MSQNNDLNTKASNNSRFSGGKIIGANSKKKLILIVLIVVLAIFIWAIFIRKTNDTSSLVNTYTVARGDISNTVRVTGKIAPTTKSELGFDRAGVVRDILVKVGDSVKVGDQLIGLDSSESYAALMSAKANLLSKENSLKEVERGLRNEEYSVEKSKVVSAEVGLNDATLAAQNALRVAYVGSNKALRTYVGSFFDDTYSSSPNFDVRVKNQDVSRKISTAHAEINVMYDEWKSRSDTDEFKSSTLDSLRYVRSNLERVKTFFGIVEEQITRLTDGNSGYSADEIDTLKNTMTTANETLNSAFDEIVTAEGNYLSALSKLSLARNEFTFKKSGSSSEDIEVARAEVSRASADVANAEAQFSKTKINSPIDGIVSMVDVNRGETVAAGKVIVNVISSDPYKIEVFVPEVDIATLKVGNDAKVTLDAYGDNVVWQANVTAIDPAETVVEGVSTYKVTLKLLNTDERIKPGMTANIDIVTESKKGVLLVPIKYISNGEVQILDEDGVEISKAVEVGSTSKDGKIEILGGLKAGQVIILPTVK